jgi:hypothetical protein
MQLLRHHIVSCRKKNKATAKNSSAALRQAPARAKRFDAALQQS